MEHFVSLQMWAVLVAAPCIIAWFLGDLHGSARIRRMIEAGELDDLPEIERPAKSQGTRSHTVTIATQRRDGVFTAMPPPNDLHTEVESIRGEHNVWDDPDLFEDLSLTNPISERVLQHYRGSISELGRSNALIAKAGDGAPRRMDTTPG